MASPVVASLPEHDTTRPAFSPRSGNLLALRTKAEVATSLQLGEVNVVRVHSKDANSVIKLVDAALADRAANTLAHLRRVAKPSALSSSILDKLHHRPSPGGTPALFVLAAPTSMLSPEALTDLLSTIPLKSTTGGAGGGTSLKSRPSSNSSSRQSSRPRSASNSQPRSAPMSRNASTQGSSQSGTQALPMLRGGSGRSQSSFGGQPMSRGASSQSGASVRSSGSGSSRRSRQKAHMLQLQVHKLEVPLAPAPNSAEAKGWSDEYWPMVYRASNPFGPQPAQWKRSAAAIEDSAGEHISLAATLAEEAVESGRGLECGAVIVSSVSEDGRGLGVVAGASDARWMSPFGPAPDSTKGGPSGDSAANGASCGAANGNPMAHAVMRAIGMVARQRVVLSRGYEAPISPILHDGPLTALEEQLSATSPLQPGGYLCTGLDIFLTHEPCIECCMAILHSRFARVVFWKESKAGGLAAEFRVGGDDQSVSEPALRPRGGGSDPDLGALAEQLSYTRIDGATIVRQNSHGGGALGGRYGLWHRAELNWRLMAWRWTDDDQRAEKPAAFHA